MSCILSISILATVFLPNFLTSCGGIHTRTVLNLVGYWSLTGKNFFFGFLSQGVGQKRKMHRDGEVSKQFKSSYYPPNYFSYSLSCNYLKKTTTLLFFLENYIPETHRSEKLLCTNEAVVRCDISRLIKLPCLRLLVHTKVFVSPFLL